MILIYTILIGAAAYRLWHVIAVDDIFEPVRARLPYEGTVSRWLVDMLYCPWCLGWWIAGALTFAWYGWSLEVLLVWPAASLITGYLDKLREKD